MIAASSTSAAPPPWRLEHKYALSETGAAAVRAAISPYMRPDRFSRAASGGAYFVRSLYFDTSDYRAYREKMAGDRARIKLRLRSYGRTPEQTPFISVELKARDGWLVRKFAGRISTAECESYLEDAQWPPSKDRSANTNAVLDEFQRLALRSSCRPVVLVDYLREALEPIDGSELRVTFDRDLEFQEADELFPKYGFPRGILDRRVVLEVKSRKPPPPWLQRIINRMELKSVPNSKYALAVERTQPGLAFVHYEAGI